MKIDYLNNNEKDVKFEEAVKIIKGQKRVTASFLQRQLIIGYARAARLLNQLEEEGFIGPAEGIKPRKVINKK